MKQLAKIILLGTLMVLTGGITAQVFTTMVTSGVGSGQVIPGVAAQGTTTTPSLVQSAASRGNTVTTQAYPINVSSGNVLVVLLGWEVGTGIATISDTLTTSWTSQVSLVSGSENCAIYSGTAGSSGADTVTVTLPSGAGFNQVAATEWRNLKTTRDTSVTGTTNGVLSMTTTSTGDLVMGLVQGNSSSGVTLPIIGWEYPSMLAGNDSGGVQWYVQPAAGSINAGISNSSSLVGLCGLALQHS